MKPGPLVCPLMVPSSVVVPSVVESLLRVSSVVVLATAQIPELEKEEFPTLKVASSNGKKEEVSRVVDPQAIPVAKVDPPQSQPSGDLRAAGIGRKVVVGDSAVTPSSRLLPNITMSDEHEPLSSPPSYHNPWGQRPIVPKSFAEITRETHVRPVFDEIPKRDPVQIEGKTMMVFSPEEVGKLSSPFAWMLVGRFASSRPTLM